MIATEGVRRKRGSHTASTIIEAEHRVADQVTSNRQTEILDYLKLFSYDPSRTILQVHMAGFFNKRQTNPKAIEQRGRKAVSRYGGTTFVVVGRTHDPSIMNRVLKPRNRREATSPGYIGYLWKHKGPQGRAPHELLPLDFTPSHIPYPETWKKMFATKGFMVALHVPASFAKDKKNKILRALYQRGKRIDVTKQWHFIDEIRINAHEQ